MAFIDVISYKMDSLTTKYSKDFSNFTSNIVKSGKVFINQLVSDDEVSLRNSSSLVQAVNEIVIEDDGVLRFSSLPPEIKMYIFSFLPAKDLCLICSISHEWNSYAQSPVIWKSKYDSEKLDWKSLENPTFHSKLELDAIQSRKKNPIRSYIFDLLFANAEKSTEEIEEINQLNWKAAYLSQIQEERRSLTKGTSSPSPSKSSSILSFVNRNEKLHWIPMFGDGLDTKGGSKALLYNMMWNPKSDIKLTQIYPGVEGVGTGVGFTVNNVKLSLSALYDYSGIVDNMRPQWKSYLQGASAFVFVLDLSRDISTAKDELHSFISNECILTTAPLLIMACHDRAPSTLDIEEITPVKLAETLEMSHESIKDRRWCIRVVDEETMEGVWEGIHWLIDQI